MLHSMTGYGRAEAEEDGLRIGAEIRTVNHRYLDLVVRLPGSLAPLEDRVRKQVAARLSRGRVEISVTVTDRREREGAIQINEPLLRAYAAAAAEVQRRWFPDAEPDLRWLVTVPGLFIEQESGPAGESAAALTERAVAAALDAVVAMRRREGEALAEQLLGGLERLREHVGAVAARAPGQVARMKERLERRLAEWLPSEGKLDEQRLAMEVVIMADKSDIEEELHRLGSHLDQFRLLVTESVPPVGRRLDFLAQEIHRELNTIGSKAVDAEISERIVAAKVELERLREQVQNIE